jgi:hypothetical protein
MFVRAALILAIVLVTPASVLADEYDYAGTDNRSWVGTGALLVNSGVALANGFSLAAGTSSHKNGVFGLVLGSTTMAVSAIGLARAEDEQSQQYSLLLGAAGLASAVTGALSIKFSAPRGHQFSVSPMINPFGSEDEAKAGLQIQARF